MLYSAPRRRISVLNPLKIGRMWCSAWTASHLPLSPCPCCFDPLFWVITNQTLTVCRDQVIPLFYWDSCLELVKAVWKDVRRCNHIKCSRCIIFKLVQVQLTPFLIVPLELFLPQHEYTPQHQAVNFGRVRLSICQRECGAPRATKHLPAADS